MLLNFPLDLSGFLYRVELKDGLKDLKDETRMMAEVLDKHRDALLISAHRKTILAAKAKAAESPNAPPLTENETKFLEYYEDLLAQAKSGAPLLVS